MNENYRFAPKFIGINAKLVETLSPVRTAVNNTEKLNIFIDYDAIQLRKFTEHKTDLHKLVSMVLNEVSPLRQNIEQISSTSCTCSQRCPRECLHVQYGSPFLIEQ